MSRVDSSCWRRPVLSGWFCFDVSIAIVPINCQTGERNKCKPMLILDYKSWETTSRSFVGRCMSANQHALIHEAEVIKSPPWQNQWFLLKSHPSMINTVNVDQGCRPAQPCKQPATVVECNYLPTRSNCHISTSASRHFIATRKAAETGKTNIFPVNWVSHTFLDNSALLKLEKKTLGPS